MPVDPVPAEPGKVARPAAPPAQIEELPDVGLCLAMVGSVQPELPDRVCLGSGDDGRNLV